MKEKDVVLAPSHVAKSARLIAKTDEMVAFRSRNVTHLKGEHGCIHLRRRRPVISTVQVEQFRELVVKAWD